MASSTNHDPLLTVQQTADYLGVTVRCVRYWIETRTIAFERIGPRHHNPRHRKIRIRQSAADQLREPVAPRRAA